MRRNSMGQKHTIYWKRKGKNSVWEGGSPHCPWDIRSLRVIDERAVQLNISSKEQLLWWPCSRQGRERQWHIMTKKLHRYIYIYMLYHCCYISLLFVSAFRAGKALLFLSMYFDIRIDLFLNTLSINNCMLSPQSA